VLAGPRGEDSIAELGRREGIAQSLYYSWSKEFLEAGKKRLAGDTARQATSAEVKDLRAEAAALKEAVADLTLENRLLKEARDHPPGRVLPLGRLQKRRILIGAGIGRHRGGRTGWSSGRSGAADGPWAERPVRRLRLCR
jgi:transposase-like protein